MNRKFNLNVITIFAVLLHLTYGKNCKLCMNTNDAYCVDETSYYLCMDGNHLTTTLYTCPVDHVCTESENICEPKIKTDGTTTFAACSTTCGKCPDSTAANKRYTCVSKYQYGRCNNGVVTLVSTCEGDALCSSEMYEKTGKICSPKCAADFLGVSNTCSNDEVTATYTTTAPGTTPSAQILKDQCNAAQNTNDKYFYVRNKDDADCKTYIYCETIDGVMEALLIKCSSGYFNSTESKCVEQKPTECYPSTATSASTTLATNPSAQTTLATNSPAATTLGTDPPAPTTLGTNSPAPTTTTQGPTQLAEF